MRLSEIFAPVSKQKGFTLVELFFAMSLVSLMTVFLLAILNTTSQIWCNNEEKIGSYREVRAALTFMTQELSSIYTGKFFKTRSFVINPEVTTVRQTDIAMNKDWASRLFFLATIPGKGQLPEANRSDLCAVGYFLAYTLDLTAYREKNTPDTVGSYKLYRFFRSSDPTFQILSGNDLVTPLFEANPGVNAEVLAIGITRFTTKAYVNGKGGLLAWNAALDKSRPDLIELSLTAIGLHHCARLRSKKEWEDHTSEFHRNYGRTFTTRVHL